MITLRIGSILFLILHLTWAKKKCPLNQTIIKEEKEHAFVSFYPKDQANETFGFGLGVTHQGESFIKDTTNGSAGPALPDYTRVDFAMYINASDNDEVRVHIENLTDELYFPHSHSTHQASVGESLSARVSYSRRF